MSRRANDLELFILLAVIRLSPEAYGVSISREIERTTKRSISLAGVYAALDRMEQSGFVTSELSDPTPERGGRSKRFFQITREGLHHVRATREALTGMWQGLPELC